MDRSVRTTIATVTAATVTTLVVGVALTPKNGDQHVTNFKTATTQLAAATTHHNGLLIGSVLVIVGLGLLAFSYLAVGMVVRERGRRWALAAMVLGAVGGLSGMVVNAFVGLISVAAADTPFTDAERRTELIGAEHVSHVTSPFVVGYFIPIIAAAVCAGIALWRSGAVPRWFGAAFPVTFFVALFAESGIDAVLILPWAAQLLWLTKVTYRESDTPVASAA